MEVTDDMLMDQILANQIPEAEQSAPVQPEPAKVEAPVEQPKQEPIQEVQPKNDNPLAGQKLSFKPGDKSMLISEEEKEYFSLGDESDGTQRIFDYIPLILDLIQGEKVFVIDEMERSLHPALMRKLIELFFKYSNNISTQLIFTTHESTLMDQDLLRRDEIWLMEKNEKGISSLSRLDETFNLRFDKELEKSYLKGLFGASPDLRDESAIQKLKTILTK